MRNEKLLIVLAIVLIAVLFTYSNYISEKEIKEISPIISDKQLESRLGEFEKNVVSGGPPKDGIPPIDNPKYVSVQEGDKFLKDSDVVFGIDYKGVQKAFPQKILVWHEIVNDEINGEKISATYCPLTGTAIGYKGNFDGIDTTFGTSGKLVNSNLVMYDRQTDSWWPQMLGIAITGENEGNELEKFPVYWTTWGKWKAKYPNTLVLSKETGFIRNYESDPYGSYDEINTYYQTGGSFFPVMASSDVLPAKEVVVGIKLNNSYLAIPKNIVKERGNVNTSISNKSIVAIYDNELDIVKVFLKENGSIEPINTHYDAMWFAWYAFYPQTELYRG